MKGLNFFDFICSIHSKMLKTTLDGPRDPSPNNNLRAFDRDETFLRATRTGRDCDVVL